MIPRTLSRAVDHILEQEDHLEIVERLAQLPFEEARGPRGAHAPLDVITCYFEVLDGTLREGRLTDSIYDAVLSRITEIASLQSP